MQSVNDVKAGGVLEYWLCGSGGAVATREIDSPVQSTVSGSIYTTKITLPDMGVPMNPDDDARGRSENQDVSLADESFVESGGGGINLMGLEFAWESQAAASDDQQHKRFDNTVCLLLRRCCEHQANDQATGKPAQVLRGI